jgi:hypothetical protein
MADSYSRDNLSHVARRSFSAPIMEHLRIHAVFMPYSCRIHAVFMPYLLRIPCSLRRVRILKLLGLLKAFCWNSISGISTLLFLSFPVTVPALPGFITASNTASNTASLHSLPLLFKQSSQVRSSSTTIK